MIAGAGSIVSLLFVSAVSISHDAQVGHQVLTERFQSRAALTASFVSGNVEDLAKREQVQAARLMSEPDVSAEVFEQVVLGFGFDAAVLLDSQGRALRVWPAKPDVIGDQLADQYPHLATALQGRIGVSGVAHSAAMAEPVIAVAVPFETSSGRRVFSGAFALSTGSLGNYFDTIVSLTGRRYLIDDQGEIVVAGESDSTTTTSVVPCAHEGGTSRPRPIGRFVRTRG